jgi:hypothetical protein
MTHQEQKTVLNNEVANPAPLSDPEVTAQAKRRHFSAGYMRRILRAAAACKAPGAHPGPASLPGPHFPPRAAGFRGGRLG